MRPAVEEITRIYQRKTGTRIDLDYADSGQLLIKIVTTHRGDIYICHDPFLAALKRKGLCDRAWTVASLKPVIAVPKGNPKGIKGLKDLTRPGLKVGLTDPIYSTCGHINKLIFKKARITEKIKKNVVTRTRCHAELANAVALRHLDAAIVWNAVAFLRRDKVDMVEIEPQFLPKPGVDTVTTATFGLIDMGYVRVTVATLKCSKQLKEARKFAEFIASPQGRAVFARYGFSPPIGGEG